MANNDAYSKGTNILYTVGVLLDNGLSSFKVYVSSHFVNCNFDLQTEAAASLPRARSRPSRSLEALRGMLPNILIPLEKMTLNTSCYWAL